MSRLPALVALVGVLLLVGCSTTVDGEAVRRPPDPLERALPSPAELRQTLGTPIAVDTQPKFGGVDVLREEDKDVSPRECAGVTHAGMRQTFRNAHVRATATGYWTRGSETSAPVSLTAAVIELETPNDTAATYDEVAAHWQQCSGTTVYTKMKDVLTFVDEITRVDNAGGQLSAALRLSDTAGLMTPALHERVLTTSTHYLIDVEVITDLSGDAEPLDTHNATAVARLIAQKLVSPA